MLGGGAAVVERAQRLRFVGCDGDSKRKTTASPLVYEYIEGSILNPRTPLWQIFTSAFGGISDMTGHADGFVSVENDPYVWSGRASQENFVELVVSGLASMYPASHEGACVKLLHFDTPPISALRGG